MFFMRFAIDVVFLDRSKTVVKVVHGLQPWRIAGARKAAPRSSCRPGRLLAAGFAREPR